ncbi:hypothetical protein R1sor_025210 [Riccia sorocarpa]|uniref:Reverse transcriptase domain-containing protein n=1 Tax=Riccia sorocarpa TaxID=122646 RepID=A0ABD3GAQ4_9MARC
MAQCCFAIASVAPPGSYVKEKIQYWQLCLKIGQDWAKWTDQDTLFFKLDFIKAYDRVDHLFLWKTLECQGFDDTFINLVKGFTTGGTARIHVNSSFSKEVQVERGVRQGCPLAPLLFALVSQPFMSMISDAERRGSLQGLEIKPGQSITHQLFADDVGLCLAAKEECFLELSRILDKFQVVSGAKVNLAKSRVMPMGKVEVPDWGVDEAVLKINRRIHQWDSAYLPWPARVVLLKHILSPIPTYTLMSVGCSKLEGLKLERVVRQFFWGVTETGKFRKPLIAWKRLIRPKYQGGLGFLGFEERAQALQMRYVSAILDGKETEWVWVAKRILQIKLLIGPSKLERKHWDIGTALLLLNSWKVSETPTLDRICQSWFKQKKRLRLSNPEMLPEELPIVSLKLIWQMMGRPISEEFRRLERGAKAQGVRQLRELKMQDGSVDLQKLATLDPGGFQEIRVWLQTLQITDVPLSLVPGWEWIERWGVADGSCPWCLEARETLEHMFWSCRRIQERVEWLKELLADLDDEPNSLLQAIDIALKLHNKQPGVLILLGEFCRQVWSERNKNVFEQIQLRVPSRVILQTAVDNCRAAWRNLRGEQADHTKQRDEEFLSKARELLDRPTRIRDILREAAGIEEEESSQEGVSRETGQQATEDDSVSDESFSTDSSWESDSSAEEYTGSEEDL